MLGVVTTFFSNKKEIVVMTEFSDKIRGLVITILMTKKGI